MDQPVNRPAVRGDDLSALAWVHGELRRSLESAHKLLRRHLKEAEASAASDVDGVDPSLLRNARSQVHQGVGALELVGLPTVATVLRASEAALQRMAARPALFDAAAADAIERVSFAVLDFLTRQLVGKPVSPVALFPQYRAALQLAAADRIHPADLWPFDFQWHELPAEPGLPARPSDDAARELMEGLTLALMRTPAPETLALFSQFCAELGAGVAGAREATLWRLAAAVFEAQAQGRLATDLYAKRIASRLLAQLRLAGRGQHEVSERLVHDLLFFCAQARTEGPPALRLDAARRAWRLEAHPSADYETVRLGRFDPAWIAQARKRVASAKEAWSAVAAGELHRAGILGEQFALVGESLARLLPAGEELGQALQRAAAQVSASEQPPSAALGMEVATAVLYIDATIEDGELDHPELGARVQRLARRIDDVRGGAAALPLEAWMEELYRRVSDRQTMGSVVHELRATLSEVEKQIDQYFRNPAERQVLIPVPGQLGAMRGVLSVLGLDQASQAVVHMRDDIDALAQTEVDRERAIQAGTFDRVADNLGALSFLIDMLSVQPGLVKSLFRFDPEAGRLAAVMGQSERTSSFAPADFAAEPAPAPAPRPEHSDEPLLPLAEQARELAAQAQRDDVADAAIEQRLESLAQRALAADQPALARAASAGHAALRAAADGSRRRDARAELARALAAFAPAREAAAPPPAAPLKVTPQAAPGGTGLEDDQEMRDIFIEEAREVVIDARAALERLADAPDNATDMTAVRRAFHTLKGSSRMVGLRDFGEGAWACEQLYNARLAQSARLDAALRQFTTEALGYLGDWVEAIAAGRDDGHRSGALTRAADALRLEGVRLAIEPPQPPAPAEAQPPADEPLPVAQVVELPASAAFEPPPVAEPSFEFELPQLPPQADLPEVVPEAAPEVLPAVPSADALPEFELDLEPAGTEPAAVGAAAAESLAARVPGLPSAADLDLAALPTLDAPEFEREPEPESGREPAAVAPADLGVDPGPFEKTEVFDFSSQSPRPDEPAPAAGEVPLPVGETLSFELDLGEFDAGVEPLAAEASELPQLAEVAPAPMVEPVAESTTESASEATMPLPAMPPPAADDEQFKLIGPLRIAIPLFNIFLNEADEQSRRLATELAEWGVDPLHHPVPESGIALAHSLAGNSATVGYAGLSALARALEHALERSRAGGVGRAGEAELFGDAADEIRRLLHQFAAGFLRDVPAELTDRLADHERWPAADQPAAASPTPEEATEPVLPPAPAGASALAAAAAAARAIEADDIDALDAIDAELFPIFEEEAVELLPQLHARLRDWHDRPGDRDAASACMRTLHTFKGGARLAGAMRLGEMAHRLETAIDALAGHGEVSAAEIDPLLTRADGMAATFEAMRHPLPAAAPAQAPVVEAATEEPAESWAERTQVLRPQDVGAPVALVPAEAGPPSAPDFEAPSAAALEPSSPQLLAPAAAGVPERAQRAIDWLRFTAGAAAGDAATARPAAAAAGAAMVRVRAGLLDRLVNAAGEVSITRERITSDAKQLQSALGELTDSLERMRRHLRDLELQAESQIASRIETARAAGESFDPLEMDRYTRFQELTRFMAESVNDVATLQRNLQRTLQSTEDELAAQARLTRELQDDLLRTRMVEFESLAERLYRTVRQAAKETGKQVRLDIVGGAIEIDRGVLERMVGPFEHLLRNAVVHGVEPPEGRAAAGKEAQGHIQIQVAQSGNEVAVEFADDGAGFDHERIRRLGVERGLLAPDASPSPAELAQLLFQSGFSTADGVTELAGRGVGLDVVRAEVNAMGGRVEAASTPGQGTRFRLLLPLTTAVTQVVMLRCGTLQVAVPSSLIEVVRRLPSAEIDRAYATGAIEHDGEAVPFFWLAALLQAGTRGESGPRAGTVALIRSAAQRVAVHVDEVVGNNEVVVKNVGPQLARLPGLAGVTLLPNGSVALIYNPVALATLYAGQARERMQLAQAGAEMPSATVPVPELRAPLVLVVDDSLTVRRVTQRLLLREGYRVVTAKDGLDALEKLADERPVVLLSDIEMPRMDGFDLVRNVRADPRLAGLPVVMITSRIAQKHRDYAAELGVDHYLGKPYAEEELLSLVARYAGADIPA